MVLNKLLGKLLLLGASCVFLLASGCEVAGDVSIEVEPDGSGVVELEALFDGNDLASVFDLQDGFSASVQDLQLAGWEVLPAQLVESGRIVVVRKAFGNPEQFGEVMAELSGTTGIFSNFVLERRQSFGNLQYELSGVVDPSNGLESFADVSLTESIDTTLTDLAANSQVTTDNIELALSVSLPGEVEDSSSLASTVTEGVEVFEVDLASQKSSVIDLASTKVSIVAQVLRGIAVLSGVAAVLVLLSLLFRYLALRSAPKKRGSIPTKQNQSTQADEQAEEPDEGQQRPYDVVAFDGMGVIYQEADNLYNLLLPFVRSQGCPLADDEVMAKIVELTLGRRTASEFWSSLGIDEDVDELNQQYLATLALTPGVVKYIMGLREQNLTVACLTNDSLEWSSMLRRKHSLNAMIDIWVISGEIGIRKPSHGAFEALRRRCNLSANRILLVDDEIEVLDAASQFGFQTALYGGESLPAGSPHSLFPRFPNEEAN